MAKVVVREELPLITIDASSTAVGIAVKRAGKPLAVTCLTGKGDYSRMVDIGQQFKTVLEALKLTAPVEVWIEQPFYSPKRSSDLSIKMMHGILLYVAAQVIPLDKLYWNYVSVNTWRKHIVPSKTKSDDAKKLVMSYTSKVFNLTVDDDNIGDALGIMDWRLRKDVDVNE